MDMTLPFRVVYCDAHVLVVEKPAGMVTHPVYKHLDGTLNDAVRAWCAAEDRGQPWLLHRLDRDTSGLVLFAWTADAMRLCAKQFVHHTVTKHYLALVWGTALPDEGIINAPLKRDPTDRRRVIVAEDGKAAQTRFAVAERLGDRALVRLWPQTGRTHQLRIHLAHIGHPIVGDVVYADMYPAAPRLLLHATALGLLIPTPDGPRRRTFLAPLPLDFATELPCGA